MKIGYFYSQKTLNQLITICNERKDYKTAAKALGMTSETARNLYVFHVGKPLRKKWTSNKKDFLEIRNLRSRGFSWTLIAEKYEVSEGTIRYRFKKMNKEYGQI